ncbi:MAG: hypothetical protein ABSB39_16930 [Candidatus Sulfotelmatobacter sp.]
MQLRMNEGAMSIGDKIDRAARLGQRLEDLVFNQVKDSGFLIRTERDDLLILYWSLIFDYAKGITCLLQNGFHSAAFALLRPTIEALVRSHVVLMGSDGDVLKIRQDKYKVKYEKVGAQLDKAFGTSPLLGNYLKKAQPLLHSLTHSGKAQLSNRFDSDGVGASFSGRKIEGLIGNSASAVFLVTIRVAGHFDFDEQVREANRIWLEYGSEAVATSATR